jgi:hypothetical protein
MKHKLFKILTLILNTVTLNYQEFTNILYNYSGTYWAYYRAALNNE